MSIGFFQDTLMNRKFKRTFINYLLVLFEIDIFLTRFVIHTEPTFEFWSYKSIR